MARESSFHQATAVENAKHVHQLVVDTSDALRLAAGQARDSRDELDVVVEHVLVACAKNVVLKSAQRFAVWQTTSLWFPKESAADHAEEELTY